MLERRSSRSLLGAAVALDDQIVHRGLMLSTRPILIRQAIVSMKLGSLTNRCAVALVK